MLGDMKPLKEEQTSVDILVIRMLTKNNRFYLGTWEKSMREIIGDKYTYMVRIFWSFWYCIFILN